VSADSTSEQVRAKRFYVAEGDGFVPTGLSTSPWRRDSQNGLALGLLMTHTLVRRPEAAQGHLARFTLDILRPAPAALTTIAWRVARGGRRVQLLEGELIAGGEVSARASALFVAPTGPPPPPREMHPPPVSPEDALERTVLARGTGVDTRLVERRTESPTGRQSLWVRVEADVVPGAGATPIGAAVAASDFGGSSLRDYSKEWTYPNLDIAVHFSRAPRGEWVHASTLPMMLGRGTAVIDHHLSDRDGPFARAHQTLFFGRIREAAP